MIDLDELEKAAKYGLIGAEDALSLLALARAGRRMADVLEAIEGSTFNSPVVAQSVKFELTAEARAALGAFREADA